MTHINWPVARNLINPTNLDALETFNWFYFKSAELTFVYIK